jgi:Subtilase family
VTAAAGNLAQRHWTGTLAPNTARYHQWSNGQHLNAILPWGNERIAVELYGALTSRCRLQVFERDTGRLVSQSDLWPEIVDGRSWGQTAVRFEPAPQREYLVGVHVLESRQSLNENFHLVVLGGNLARATEAGSIPFPGDGENVITIGCADELRQRLSYSSCGPNSRRPKPDFVAQVPFPSRFRERPFTGTSAAAPQGAGLAALLLSRDPSLTPERVRELLQGAAIDLLQPGHDRETGYGLLHLPR